MYQVKVYNTRTKNHYVIECATLEEAKQQEFIALCSCDYHHTHIDYVEK